jgi:hypothetical protein
VLVAAGGLEVPGDEPGGELVDLALLVGDDEARDAGDPLGDASRSLLIRTAWAWWAIIICA